MSQQPPDMDNMQHTLSQNTSVGVDSSDDEIEQFEDDDSWWPHHNCSDRITTVVYIITN